MTPVRYSLDDLKYLMARLRDPDGGCPWDLAQSYETIAPSTIEEAYEVVDAIEHQNYQQLKEELGDLLFQAIFYSQLAAEERRFDFDDIVHGITEKLIRRHPHVFPEGDLRARFSGERTEEDELAIKRQWEALKQGEREEKGMQGTLDDIPVGLPALKRAAKLQKRASRVGFDWPEVAPVFDKLEEELNEIREAIAENDSDAIAEEVGDLLFATVNLARHLNVEPETSLRSANRKFYDRFRYIEETLSRQGRSCEEASLDEMDALWDQAKQHLKGSA